MPTIDDLLNAVDAAFAETSVGLDPWPNPRADGRPPAEDEYSRVTDPERWRIVSARAEAWERALVALGVASLDRDVEATWRHGNIVAVSRTDRVWPCREGAQALTVARTSIDDVSDFGVVLGFGDPPVVVERFPDCGCDACDSGSANELEHLDDHLLDIVGGTYRQAGSGARIRYWGRYSSGESWSLGRAIGEPYDLSGAAWFDLTGSWTGRPSH